MNPAEFSCLANAERQFWWFRGMRRILFRLLDRLLAGRSIRRTLEAGCGTGYFARVLQARYDWQVFPVDLAWEGLRHGRQLGVNRLTQADVTRLPFRDASFDVVFSLDVIVHCDRGQEGGMMGELTRVLAPGGLLVLRAAALSFLHSRHSQFTGERQRFTRSRLIALAERHGIRVLRSSYANSLLAPVAFLKFRIWEPLLNKPPASGLAPLPNWLDRLLYLPLVWESHWLGAGLNLPWGQSVILIGEKRKA